MQQQLKTLLAQPSSQFNDVITWIDQHYAFTPIAFQNGAQHNAANQNNGSCKVFALAILLGLGAEQTLQLFCEHYQAVLNHPDGSDHQNIRQFMAQGFDGLVFEAQALHIKK